jgi:feruloyl esterase
MDALVDWVEEGKVPDTLRAVGPDGHGKIVERDLCPYPQVQVYVSGDPAISSSFKCVEW